MNAPLTEQGAESREKIKKDIRARRVVAGQPQHRAEEEEEEENAKNTPGEREREMKDCMIGH